MFIPLARQSTLENRHSFIFYTENITHEHDSHRLDDRFVLLVEHRSRVLAYDVIRGFNQLTPLLHFTVARHHLIRRRFRLTRVRLEVHVVLYIVHRDRLLLVHHVEVLAFLHRVGNQVCVTASVDGQNSVAYRRLRVRVRAYRRLRLRVPARVRVRVRVRVRARDVARVRVRVRTRRPRLPVRVCVRARGVARVRVRVRFPVRVRLRLLRVRPSAGSPVSYVQVVEPARQPVRGDPAAVRASHGVRAAVRLAAETVQDVLERPVVHLVLVEEFLLADRLRLRLQLVDHRLLNITRE